MSEKPTKEEALQFITTWRDSLDEPRVEDGYWHDPADDLHNYFEATGARDCHDVSAEATKVYNIMFVNEHDDESCIVEDESPIAGVWNAAAAQAAQSQMSQNPVKPKVWRNGRDPNQPATTREHKFYQSVNAIFESLINIDEAQAATTGPITISDYMEQAFVHFMKNPVFNTPEAKKLIEPLAKKVEDTYATDKGKAAIQELVDFGYNILYKLKNSATTRAPNNRNAANTSNAGNAQNAGSSKFAQAISIIDQLNPKQKKKILSYINSELNPTAAAPNTEKVSIGGQEIKPGDPLYDKIKGNLD
jgi:F0F1-type ATP synthase delta subunit